MLTAAADWCADVTEERIHVRQVRSVSGGGLEFESDVTFPEEEPPVRRRHLLQTVTSHQAASNFYTLLTTNIAAVFPPSNFSDFGTPVHQSSSHHHQSGTIRPLPTGHYNTIDWTHPDLFNTSGSNYDSQGSGSSDPTIVLTFYVFFPSATAADLPVLGLRYVEALSTYTGAQPCTAHSCPCLRSHARTLSLSSIPPPTSAVGFLPSPPPLCPTRVLSLPLFRSSSILASPASNPLSLTNYTPSGPIPCIHPLLAAATANSSGTLLLAPRTLTSLPCAAAVAGLPMEQIHLDITEGSLGIQFLTDMVFFSSSHNPTRRLLQAPDWPVVVADLITALETNIGSIFPAADFDSFGGAGLSPGMPPYSYNVDGPLDPWMEPLSAGAYYSFDWTHPDNFMIMPTYGSGSDSEGSFDSDGQDGVVVFFFSVTFPGAIAADLPILGPVFVTAVSTAAGEPPSTSTLPLSQPLPSALAAIPALCPAHCMPPSPDSRWCFSGEHPSLHHGRHPWPRVLCHDHSARRRGPQEAAAEH